MSLFISHNISPVNPLCVSGFHGFRGPLTINDMRGTPLGETFVKAGVELGYPQVDVNAEQQLGMHISFFIKYILGIKVIR